MDQWMRKYNAGCSSRVLGMLGNSKGLCSHLCSMWPTGKSPRYQGLQSGSLVPGFCLLEATRSQVCLPPLPSVTKVDNATFQPPQ